MSFSQWAMALNELEQRVETLAPQHLEMFRAGRADYLKWTNPNADFDVRNFVKAEFNRVAGPIEPLGPMGRGRYGVTDIPLRASRGYLTSLCRMTHLEYGKYLRGELP